MKQYFIILFIALFSGICFGFACIPELYWIGLILGVIGCLILGIIMFDIYLSKYTGYIGLKHWFFGKFTNPLLFWVFKKHSGNIYLYTDFVLLNYETLKNVCKDLSEIETKSGESVDGLIADILENYFY